GGEAASRPPEKRASGPPPSGKGRLRPGFRACVPPPQWVSIPVHVHPRTAMKSSTSPSSFPQPEIGREMKGADVVVECLIREGVDVIFAYPGGASQELHQALARTDK